MRSEKKTGYKVIKREQNNLKLWWLRFNRCRIKVILRTKRKKVLRRRTKDFRRRTKDFKSRALSNLRWRRQSNQTKVIRHMSSK